MYRIQEILQLVILTDDVRQHSFILKYPFFAFDTLDCVNKRLFNKTDSLTSKNKFRVHNRGGGKKEELS